MSRKIEETRIRTRGLNSSEKLIFFLNFHKKLYSKSRIICTKDLISIFFISDIKQHSFDCHVFNQLESNFFSKQFVSNLKFHLFHFIFYIKTQFNLSKFWFSDFYERKKLSTDVWKGRYWIISRRRSRARFGSSSGVLRTAWNFRFRRFGSKWPKRSAQTSRSFNWNYPSWFWEHPKKTRNCFDSDFWCLHKKSVLCSWI